MTMQYSQVYHQVRGFHLTAPHASDLIEVIHTVNLIIVIINVHCVMCVLFNHLLLVSWQSRNNVHAFSMLGLLYL